MNKANGKLNDHITSMIQVNESFFKNCVSASSTTTTNIEAVRIHINSLIDSESVKEYISKLRQKIKAIGSKYIFHFIIYLLTFFTDDVLQKKTQQQQQLGEKAVDITHLKIKLLYVITSLDALEVSWQQVLPITDYLYSLKLYIYNPILELLETKQGINNIESLKDSDNIYTKLDNAIADYQEVKTIKYNKYRYLPYHQTLYYLLTYSLHSPSDDFERLKFECRHIIDVLESLPEWLWMKSMVTNLINNHDNDVTATMTPFIPILQSVCNGNLLPYFLQSNPVKGKSPAKQVNLITAIKELEKHVNTSIAIDYEYINALLSDFHERVTALQIILHSKDFITMYKEHNTHVTAALLHVKECEGNVNNFNLMKKEYEEWSANMKKMIEEIIFTEFFYRVTIKI